MNRPKPKIMARKALQRKVTNTEFEVEKIIDKKEAFGVIYYQVKWLGYNEITWEPAANLIGNDLNFGAYELVQEFEDSLLNLPSENIPLAIQNNLNTNQKQDKNSNQMEDAQANLQEEVQDTHFSALSNNYFKPQAKKKNKQVELLTQSFNCQLNVQNTSIKKQNKAKAKEAFSLIQKGKDQENQSKSNESGSLSKGDIVDRILSMQSCLNDNGQQSFYCIVSWKIRKNGTQPSKSRIRTSALTKHSALFGDMYRRFVEKTYLSKYFIK